MSGASKRNPAATDYKGGGSPSDIPPLVIGCQLVCQTAPTAEWMRNNPPDPDTGKRPPCPPEHGEVLFVITGRLLVPSITATSKESWPYAEAALLEVARMPYPEYLAKICAANPDFMSKVQAPPPLIVPGN